MDEYQDIIAILKKQKPVEPPAELTLQVMGKLEHAEEKASYSKEITPFRSLVQKTISSGRITSYEQCALLLFLIGSFYLVAGMTAIVRLSETIGLAQFSVWLKVQPFIPAGSGLVMMAAAFMIVYRPNLAAMIQYFLMLHVVFLFVNAVVLENMLILPAASIYVLILTLMAVAMGIMLIGTIQSVLKIQVMGKGKNCAKTV